MVLSALHQIGIQGWPGNQPRVDSSAFYLQRPWIQQGSVPEFGRITKNQTKKAHQVFQDF